MEMEYLNYMLNISLYLQYNTIEGLMRIKNCHPEEVHSHPVCEGFFYFEAGLTGYVHMVKSV